MKLHFQNSTSTYSPKTEHSTVSYSRASEKAVGFAHEKEIQSLQQQNVIDEYFKLYDQNYSDVAIKNLIAARLQPSYQLPQIHDAQTLASKTDKLLTFSLSI